MKGSPQQSDSVSSSGGFRWPLLVMVAVAAAYFTSFRQSDSRLDWPGDFKDAQVASLSSGKPLLVAFTTPSCHYCVEMERHVLVDGQVVETLRSFERVKVDAWNESSLAAQFHVEGVPAFVVLGPEGTLVSKIEGYYPADEFKAFLQQSAKASARIASR